MTASFFTRQPLSRKIIAVIVMTTVVATLALMPAIFFTLQSGMQGQRQRQLAGVRNLVERLIEENRRTVRNYAALFASDRQVKDNLYYYAELAGEREHPVQAVRHLVDAFSLEYIELGDRYGKVVVDAAMPELFGTDRSGEPLLRQALAGEVVTGIKPFRDAFLLMAVAPIFHDEGQLIGTITTGMALNSDFAVMIKTLSGADIAILDPGGRAVAASLAGFTGETAAQRAGRMSYRGMEYQLMALPFTDVLARPLGSIAIMSEDPLPEILHQTNMVVIIVLVAVAFLSISVSTILLRRVLAPIQTLRIGAERIGRGQFDHRLPVTSADEIGGLAEVFNAMAANLQHMREVQEKLKHAERLASIGEFTAATAHELNNPIANIIGLAKVLRLELPAGDDLGEDLDLIVKEAGRCGAIVRDLLVYSRASQPRREWVDLNRLVEEAIDSIRQRYLAGREIIVQFTPVAAVQAFVDPHQIGQVFRNLLINAAQAIAGQGEIAVRIAADSSGAISISVADSGSGIRPEDLDRIFYPFFTTKKTGEGTGLGLAVCYTIIQAHSGAINAANRRQGGAEFTVTLPEGQNHA